MAALLSRLKHSIQSWFSVWRALARPYGVPLAQAMAASKLSTVVRFTVGPNTSVWNRRAAGATSSQTQGCM